MPPPQQKPTAPTLPLLEFVALEEGDRGDAVGGGLCRVELLEHFARLLLVGRRAPERRQIVDRQRHEALERHATRDILGMRVEAAVLVHDDDGAELAALVCRTREIAHHLALGARPLDVLGLQPGVVGRHDLGTRRICGKQRRDRRRGGARACQLGQLFHEIAPVQRQMRVFVIGIDHRLRDGRGGHCELPFPDEDLAVRSDKLRGLGSRSSNGWVIILARTGTPRGTRSAHQGVAWLHQRRKERLTRRKNVTFVFSMTPILIYCRQSADLAVEG